MIYSTEDEMLPAKPTFRIGEKDGTSENPNDSAWNSTKRVVSFWMKGECASMNVQVSASTGAKYVQYLFGTGTNGALSGGNAKVYLGYAAPEDWVRFERNVEADFEAYAGGGATWTNTDGLYIHWPKELLSYAFYVDDLRLSDSLTVEHNTLGPGVIGHILRHTTWDATTLARTDRWFHYDQVGSVLNESDEAGDDVTRHEQDAFGNVMVSWAGGLWYSPSSGYHLNSKPFDSSLDVVYMLHRWYLPEFGTFASKAPLGPSREHPYTFASSYPPYMLDVLGDEDMNVHELSFALNLTPWNALVYYACTKESVIGSSNYFSVRIPRKSSSVSVAAEANAIRHAAWQCCLSKRFDSQSVSFFGAMGGEVTPSQLAQLAGDAHEANESAGSADSAVDQLNNSIGRDMPCRAEDCWKRAVQKYQRGKLFYDNRGTPKQGLVP